MKIEPIYATRPAAPPSRLDTEMYHALEHAASRVYPGSTTLPTMLTASTDMAQLRAKGIQSYGIGPALSADDFANHAWHSDVERIPEDSSLYKFVEFTWNAVNEVAVGNDRASQRRRLSCRLGRGLVFCAFAVSRPSSIDQVARIEQVLRPEIVARPAAAGFEFDSQEVADFTKYAILHFADQHALRIGDAVGSPQRHRAVHLKTGARKRDVFKVSHAAANAASLILPLYVHQVGTKQTGFNTPVHHICTCLSSLPPYLFSDWTLGNFYLAKR